MPVEHKLKKYNQKMIIVNKNIIFASVLIYRQ